MVMKIMVMKIMVMKIMVTNETNLTQDFDGIANFPMWSPVPR
jgi:hypothetical protein